MPEFTLQPHPQSAARAIDAIEVEASRPTHDRIALTYRIRGDLDAIRWPEPTTPGFAHELWQHTCPEAFVAGDGDFYRELNLSPSGQFAVYDFNGYRAHMRDADERDVAIAFDRAAGVLRAEVAMPALADVATWRVGLTCVIEERSGYKSFWALSHPVAAEPQFHNDASFLARLTA